MGYSKQNKGYLFKEEQPEVCSFPDPRKWVLNKTFVKKLLGIVDQGLCNGIGDTEPDEEGVGRGIPGSMCVEAAVAYSMGLPHTDQPTCVVPWLHSLKIGLNDDIDWEDEDARASGLRGLAVAQLGTKPINGKKSKFKADTFIDLFSLEFIASYFGTALAKALGQGQQKLSKTQRSAVRDLMVSVSDDWRGIDSDWSDFINDVNRKDGVDFTNDELTQLMVDALRRMKTPGSKYLYLL